MSKIVTESVTTKCDMTKQDATTEREFTVAGITYHLDLSDKSAKSFDEALGRYTAKASVVNVAPEVLRSWAKENGYDVGARGRIGSGVIDAFAKDRLGVDTEEPVDSSAE